MKYSVLGIALGILAISILVIGSFFVGFAPIATAANVTDTATIDVEVSGLTLIDVNPAEFTWTGIDPGTNTSTKQAQIENIGSTNFTWIWFNVTQPANRPFGTGLNGSYVASNFLWIAKEDLGADSDYFTVDRLEFNETRSLVYITDPDGNTPPDHSKFTYGRFRNTSHEYFWFINKSGGDCNGAMFWIGDVAHTQGVTGTIDFSSCSNSLDDTPGTTCRSGTLATSSVSDWCYAHAIIGEQTSGRNYTVAVWNDTSGGGTNLGYRVRWSHWNAEAPGGVDWAEGNSLHNDYFSSSLIIYPGNSTVADLKIYLPFGVAKGYSSQGTLTVFARSDPEPL
jgi:hypothetical protein